MNLSTSKAGFCRIATALAAFAFCPVAGCAGGGGAEGGGGISKIEIVGETSLAAGDARQLVARVVYEDGSTAELTGDAAWRTSDEAVATITEDGMVRAVGKGTVGISVDYSGAFETKTLLVLP